MSLAVSVGSPVSVDCGSTESASTEVLFHGGLLPPCEGLEVAEAGVTVVVGVPQRGLESSLLA